MKLCAWAGAHCLLPVVVLLAVRHVGADQQPKERHYYIAAVEIDWNYNGNDTNKWGPTYKKVVFREYEKDFRHAKTHPSWLGLLGPTLRAEQGETIVVTFRNMASGPYSLHPHGVAYGKQSEGANYFDNTSQKEKEDDIVLPNGEHVYYWEVTSGVSPQPNDPTCLTYTYTSHINVVEDYNSGLIGPLLICKSGSLDEAGKQVGVHQEYVFLFGVFDEEQSKYHPNGHASDNHVKYTINGYVNGSLPDVSVCAHTSVSLHLVGMSSEPEVFSVHMNGQVLQQSGHKVSSVGLISGSSATASMVAVHTGRWLLSSHNVKHIEMGMHAFVDVKKCDGFEAPQRRMTYAQRRYSTEWKYYIAAEEIIWDYTPNVHEHVDEDFKLQYLRQSSTRIGGKYEKAVYTLYNNESFTERLNTKQRKNELGILGPVIRAQIRDVIKIVFKNMASRPYSIYPHGLTIEKSEEGVNYPEGGNHSHGVQPGETHTYVWKVTEEDEPLDGDSRCLTRLYHSAVDTPRDIASGLIGPILICKSHSLNVKNVQKKADKEQHAVFSVFDENKSWYLDRNIRQYCDRSKVNKKDLDFYKSNVMHTINGYAFESGPVLGFCNRELATWHVSSIGAQDYIQTATFYGHTFDLNDRTEDFLSLYPMTGETITMTMDNIGVWLLSSLNSHETTKGMRVKFQDVVCYRDRQYEYEYDYDPNVNKDFTVWQPPTLEDIKKEDEKLTPAEETSVELDMDTEMFAEELGLRSLKNQTGGLSLEQLDLSSLDYDAIDVLEADTTVSLNFEEPKKKTETSFPNLDALNETLSSNLNLTADNLQDQSISDNTTHIQNSNTTSVYDNSSLYQTDNTTAFNRHFEEPKKKTETSFPNLDALIETLFSNLNLTADNLQDQSISDNTTHIQNSNTTSVYDNSSLYQTDNTIAFNSHNLFLQNDSITTNSSASGVVSSPDFVAVSGTKNTTVHNVTASPVVGNLSTETTNLSVSLQETTNLTVTLSGNSSSNTESERMNVTLTVDNQTSVEDSDERLTRGDVFSYSVHLSRSSINNPKSTQDDNVSVNRLLQSINREDENPTNQFNMSAGGANRLLPVQTDGVGEVNISTINRHNLTNLRSVVEIADKTHKTNNNDSLSPTVEPEYGLQINSSEVVTLPANSSLENVTDILLKTWPDVTVNISTSVPSGWNSSESWDNVTTLLSELTNTPSMESFSLEAVVPGNLSLSSDKPSESDSYEEVFIYLQENNTAVIKTSSLKPQSHNWTYEETHQIVPINIPDHMRKYFEEEAPKMTPPPKRKIKKVNLRQRPQTGQGLKTRRRKEYKPQARSGLPFSPRGFHPGMSPRGVRPNGPQPVSDEEELINMPVVIGVPRPDFSDYELYVPGDEPDHLGLDEQDVKHNEYEYVMYKDPYSSREDIKNLNLDETTKFYLKLSGPKFKTYFIAAEEVEWDYGGYGQRRPEKSQHNTRETKFTKVVFRGYLDSSFSTPDIRGEIDEHLGILGPIIKAEVGQSIMVVFRNNANRPYSIHPNGVSYTKQTEGLSYEDGSTYWYKYDNEVQPNTTYTYLWKVSDMVGPKPEESHCRTWAYYSGVNPERDIHSGLIGPLLVCREGTLDRELPEMREFTLLFMTFDESQSWYYEKNREIMQRKSRRRILDRNLQENFKFHSINGIIYSLKGLRMYTNQLVCWHLINMGSPKDFHSVHFHGQTFIHKKTSSYRHAVYPLLPGGFATLEMYPSKPGLWQLETEVGFHQQRGMQTLFLALDNDCYRPLGLQSGSVKDDQITANNTRGHWEPHLARLSNQGQYNAWSTERNSSWIQVDFQRPVVISKVATQGAKQMFSPQFVKKYSISYSNDRRKWTFYKGDSKDFRKLFTGNQGAYETKSNTFFPPMVGRFIRLHPITWYNAATVRMEFYGCELDGCSVPLGMEDGLIKDHHITASSSSSSWYSGPWKPSLARVNRQGTINAWRAKYNDMNQWLQVELPQIKKITGIITQGAKSLGTEMYVISYTLQYSDNGIHWNHYTDDENQPVRTFFGNNNNNDHVKNYIFPPIFSRFIRIVPKSWIGSITMRIELLGCDFE
ncbi:coagulation factor V [Brachyistius frenatus]|uniref:coagulation factor V n=1 Tax=Brachyistius frenatus TaxID=100188 RepID=UPI0037E78D14